jgi:general secretion pathway protein G
MQAVIAQGKKMKPILLCSVLAFLLSPFIDKASADNKYLRAFVDIGAIETALNLYKLKYEDYPIYLEELAKLDQTSEGKAEGQQVNQLLIDPWKNAYIYNYPPKYSTLAYDIYSVSANGVDEKGMGDDVSNWRGTSNIPDEKLRDIFVSKSEALFFGVVACFIILVVLFFVLKRRKALRSSLPK